MAVCFGHKQTRNDFLHDPISVEQGHDEANAWKVFVQAATEMKQDAPPSVQPTLGKHCYTTASHVVVSHLYLCALRFLQSLTDGGAPADDARSVVHGSISLLSVRCRKPVGLFPLSRPTVVCRTTHPF